MTSELDIGIFTVRLTKGFGVDVVVDQQATRLTREGYKVTVYASEYDKSFYPNRCYKISSPSSLLSRLSMLRHDIIVAHTSPFFEELTKFSGLAKTIAYEHGDPTPSLFPEQEAAIREGIKQYKLHDVYPNVDGVIAISKFIAEDIHWEKAHIIYNGANHLPANTETINLKTFQEKLGLKANFPTYLSVCRLSSGERQYKGVDHYLTFCKHLEQGNCLLLGRGTEEDRKYYEAQGFTVILNASQQELIAAYQLCDLYLSFSKWEGFNLPLVEAQRYGRPALALDTSCHREVCPHIFTSPEEMAQFCNHLTAEDKATLAEAGKAFVSRFSWEDNTQHLINYLQEIVMCSSEELSKTERFKRSIKIVLPQVRDWKQKLKQKLPNKVKTILSKVIAFSQSPHGKTKALWTKIGKRWQSSPEQQEALTVPVPKPYPFRSYQSQLISICILTKNRYELITECLQSLLETTAEDSVEILVGDTGSDDDRVFDFYQSLPQVVKVYDLKSYHFSRNNNELARYAKGEILVFLNNDTKALPQWLMYLIRPFQCSRVGITGSRLLYRDGTIQHAGVEFFSREPYRYIGWHPWTHFPADEPKANQVLRTPGVTGACLSIRHQLFDQLGGFDESYAEECQDIDLCLRAFEKGYGIIYEPRATLFHYENGTRQLSESEPDRLLFRNRWQLLIDHYFFRKETQSSPWTPLILIYPHRCSKTLAEILSFLQELEATYGKLEVTLKTPNSDDHIAQEFKAKLKTVLSQDSLVVTLSETWEDATQYDSVIL
ncbi:MAG: glycosyltransferase [Halothece sp. Uz-M2-17]|nr:glycosyltransferase [Halothece sp. Uz-M2-17]